MTNEEKDKKEYELAVLVVNEADVASVVALIKEHHGEDISEPRAKHLRLEYEIKKHTEAVFVNLTFHAYGEDVKALETELNSRPNVIRSMFIASPAPSQPSVTMPPQERRAPRPAHPMPVDRPAARPLSNEALEKKIEEILQ